MPWTTDQIDGHLCDVFEPTRSPGTSKSALIYLHGVHLQRLVDCPAFDEQFDRHSMRVVCPHTKRSWWTDRICREFDPEVTAERHVLDCVVPYIERRWSVRPPQIGLLGTSMGGQGALRFAYKHPDTFPVVAAISPAIDYHIRFAEGDETLPDMYRDPEEARQDTALLHIHPLNWPRHQFFACDPEDTRWWDSVDRLRMKLHSLGVPHQCDLETTGGGHSFEYYGRMADDAVTFLHERLEAEARRLRT